MNMSFSSSTAPTLCRMSSATSALISASHSVPTFVDALCDSLRHLLRCGARHIALQIRARQLSFSIATDLVLFDPPSVAAARQAQRQSQSHFEFELANAYAKSTTTTTTTTLTLSEEIHLDIRNFATLSR